MVQFVAPIQPKYISLESVEYIKANIKVIQRFIYLLACTQSPHRKKSWVRFSVKMI